MANPAQPGGLGCVVVLILLVMIVYALGALYSWLKPKIKKWVQGWKD